ncbi:predicted RNA-binding protein, contains TRAM domain [Halarchaeum acidiphilum MH1-52-1]|uniref:Predicted RNA-binding protein, contains TRAM domain n=1 Tax=Halarchaeum acidiphilum MH1-52-1 TaxID=1261545 RepID=U2YSJ2_9EURY|nr:TRAM domain-containing protein [Halarchaeum acidiphilum]GAD51970.1 predicted RNA-binding protein, contains TRAM domain [Halarchaeum acidiphilum MH1-52-1]
MEISDQLLCLFNAEVTVSDDEYVVRIPTSEIEAGSVDPGEIYRVALIDREDAGATGSSSSSTGSGGASASASGGPQPPVEEGEIRYVEIEDIGKQGDGIARVERGYVIIVPGVEVGERVKVEITQVKSNFAVGETIDDDADEE